MGAAIVDNDGNLTHVTLDSESPVTTGKTLPTELFLVMQMET